MKNLKIAIVSFFCVVLIHQLGFTQQNYSLEFLAETDSLYGNDDSIVCKHQLPGSYSLTSSNTSETAELASVIFSFDPSNSVQILELTPSNGTGHGFQMNGLGMASVMEDQMLIPIGAFIPTDRFLIYRDLMGYMNYEVNGVLYYTSTNPVWGELNVRATFNSVASMSFVYASFLKASPIAWNQRIDCSYAKNTQTLTSTASLPWESGGISLNESIAGSDGYFIFKAESLTFGMAAMGISQQNLDNSFASMDHCFLIDQGGQMVHLFDNGSWAGSYGPFNFTEHFKIIRNIVNGTWDFTIDNVLYHSVTDVYGKMYGDISFQDPSSALNLLKSTFPVRQLSETNLAAGFSEDISNVHTFKTDVLQFKFNAAEYHDTTDTLEYVIYDQNRGVVFSLQSGMSYPPGTPVAFYSNKTQLLSLDFSTMTGLLASNELYSIEFKTNKNQVNYQFKITK